ncbi:MAG: pyridoxal phosphate-dependent decarboxylase family protein, partial [Gaiellaceae bacterium]
MHAGELDDVLSLVATEVRRYLDGLDERPLLTAGTEAAARSLGGPLPEEGEGALAALRELLDEGIEASVASSGPRIFHFVTGGVTPAALGADWLTSALDQNGFAWVESPLSAELERVSIAWLEDLFGLPESWGGVLTTGATMANFVALAAARRWWGERHRTDVDVGGLTGLPPVPVFSSGYVHATAYTALGMLVLGRGAVRVLASDDAGRLDLAALERELEKLGGAPAIVIANAGEVNAGDFDPIDAVADLAERYGAWLHVDGAFGLFARVSPRTAELAAAVERADSVIADGHK